MEQCYGAAKLDDSLGIVGLGNHVDGYAKRLKPMWILGEYSGHCQLEAGVIRPVSYRYTDACDFILAGRWGDATDCLYCTNAGWEEEGLNLNY